MALGYICIFINFFRSVVGLCIGCYLNISSDLPLVQYLSMWHFLFFFFFGSVRLAKVFLFILHKFCSSSLFHFSSSACANVKKKKNFQKSRIAVVQPLSFNSPTNLESHLHYNSHSVSSRSGEYHYPLQSRRQRRTLITKFQ